MAILSAFVESSHLLPFTDTIVAQTIALRREHRIKLPDAIIAATALTFGLKIITRNTRDFEEIEGLVCINPHQI